jgi:hypothetical protein
MNRIKTLYRSFGDRHGKWFAKGTALGVRKLVKGVDILRVRDVDYLHG